MKAHFVITIALLMSTYSLALVCDAATPTPTPSAISTGRPTPMPMTMVEPHLSFETPQQFQSVARRLGAVSGQRLIRATELIGLRQPGPSIRVILAPERTSLAQRVPAWVVGYALGDAGVIVLLPERIPTYPYDSFESVLVHEVAHVLIARAASGHVVPRWFDEGLATVAAHPWEMEDQARLLWAALGGGQATLLDLNEWFRQDGASARHAYVLSAAFQRFLLRQWGPEAPGKILAGLGRGIPFSESFGRVTSASLAEVEAAFWAEQTLWYRWIPMVTSTATLWLTITFLVFYAYYKRRRRATAIQEQWEEEDRWGA